MTEAISGLLVAGLAYLLGSVPFGLLLTRLAGLGDIRQIGSGNIGATNVLRTGRRDLALLTLLLDGGKGALAVLLARTLLDEPAAIIAGLAAVLGHLFPLFLRFRGGKGVATTLGTVMALAWPIGLMLCLTWLIVAGIFRLSSLAALCAIAAAPIYAWCLGQAMLLIPLGLMAVMVWWAHRANITRLLQGTEPQIGKRHAASPPK